MKHFYSGPKGSTTGYDYSMAPYVGTTTNTGYLGGSYGDHLSNYNGINTLSIKSNNMMNWVYNECLDKFYEKLKQSETNIALTIGEGKETGRMFKVFRSVDKVVKAFRQARKLVKANPTMLLAQTHLSVKYGWTPLFNDIWNYADWTYRTFSVGIPVKARRKKSFPVSDSYSDSTWYRRVTGTRSYQAEIEVVCYVEDPDWFTASRLTSLNPAAIAWELTTLSFVVDWLYDIGSYLENLENSLGTGLSFRRGYVTRVYYHKLQEVQSSSGRAYTSGWNKYMTSEAVRAVKLREVLTGFPRPVKPTLKLRMGSGRILSAAALSRTILLGKVKGGAW